MIEVKYFPPSTILSEKILFKCTFLYINKNRLWIYKASSDGLPIFNRTGKLEGISSLTVDEKIGTIDEWELNEKQNSSFRDKTLQTRNGINPGEYHLRMWRPGVTEARSIAPNLNVITQSIQGIRILVEEIEKIFLTINPCSKNFDVYGHNLRNILLIACMEVEAALTGILMANNYNKDRLTTNDYVKLLIPMMLDAYEVKLLSYPDIPTIKPFLNWDSSNPTKSLPWYDAYNKTKHDRESNFTYATLEHAINSIAAAIIILYAQFGLPETTAYPLDLNFLKSFKVSKTKYFLPDDFYIPLGINDGLIDGTSDDKPVKIKIKQISNFVTSVPYFP